MAKEVAGLIKLQIKGGAANPSPPVGPALGSSSTPEPRIRQVRFFLSLSPTMQTSLLASSLRLPPQLFSCWRQQR